MKKILLFTIICLIFISFAGISLAEDENNFPGLTITPVIKELNAQPGNIYSDSVQVTNIASQPLEVNITVQDFTALDESGKPEMLAVDEISSYSLKTWIKISEEKVTLAAKEKKEISYTITVPQKAEPGGHYGAIVFSPAIPSNFSSSGSQVVLGTQVASMILLNIEGNSLIQGNIKEFSTQGNKFLYYNYQPVEFVTRIENSGTVHLKPLGFITIKNIFNKEVASLAVNPENGNVLPEQIRRFSNNWPYGRRLGLYKADLNLVYGNSQTLAGQVSFWILPWKESLAGLIILLVLIWLIRHLEWKK